MAENIKTKDKKKESVRAVFKKNWYLMKLVWKVCPARVVWAFINPAARYFYSILTGIVFLETIVGFLEKGSAFSETIPFLTGMENVGFSYFGSEKQVLKDINISICKGEKIALVGENGAGKSTLVKLLMRLYDPTEGRVTLNGEDVKEYAVEEYRNLFGTVFQDCKVFSLTVAENVVMREVKEEDRERIEEALKNRGVYEKVQSLPKGMDTMLTRSFDPEGAV